MSEIPTTDERPLKSKSYGSIPHLIGSRRGPMDKGVNEGQQRICCEKKRDKFDTIIVQEKLDGANVSAALIDGRVVAITRGGHLASSSEYPHHHLWGEWVRDNEERFRLVLQEGERLCGEWLALAHGTIYDLPHEPFVAFDLMKGTERLTFEDFSARVGHTFVMPRLIHIGDSMSVEEMLRVLEPSGHGARGLAEGAIWRVERFAPARKKTIVDFLAKYVRPEKEDGQYLPMPTHPERQSIWLWKPKP